MEKKAVSGLLSTLLLLSVLALAFNVPPTRAEPTTWYVDDDRVECPDADFTTIQDAVDAAHSGDRILVFPGMYYENAEINKALTIMSTDGSEVTVVNARGSGSAFAIEADNVTIDGFTMINGYWGVFIRLDADSNVVSSNEFRNLWCGVSTLRTAGNEITDNVFEDNEYGVYLQWCRNSKISHNRINHSMERGINDAYGLGNEISNNTIISTGDFGIVFWYAQYDVVSKNDIADHNVDGIAISNSRLIEVQGNYIRGSGNMGIELNLDSHHNIIIDNHISENRNGIGIFDSDENDLRGNVLGWNEIGIWLQHSEANSIVQNIIFESSFAGIWLIMSDTNHIYHNSLVENLNQALINDSNLNTWDDDYPSGGNHWSDHVTVDNYSGMNQDELGSDGIVDEPYVIDDSNRDDFPLVATPEAIGYIIQNLPPSEFIKPEEDIEDVKNDFMDKLADVEESIKEGDFERAIEHLEEIRNFTYDQTVDATKRQEIIAMIDSLTAYLENLL